MSTEGTKTSGKISKFLSRAVKPFLMTQEGEYRGLPNGKRVVDDRFEIEAVIGEGQFSAVYSARDVILDRKIAVKILSPDPKIQKLVAFEKTRDAFIKEARIVASLRHPNIVTLYDFGEEEDGSFYLVMEYIKGKTLATRGRVLAYEVLIDVFCKLLDALNYIHTQSPPLLHRDIKLVNILLDDRDEPYLIDFGFGRMISTEQSAVGWENVFKGSPDYVAPEWITYYTGTLPNKDRRLPDARADLWSLGNCLYRLLTREQPIPRREMGDYFRAVQTKERIRKPSELNPNLETFWDETVMRFLAYDVEDRYQNAFEARDALLALKPSLPRSDDKAFKDSAGAERETKTTKQVSASSEAHEDQSVAALSTSPTLRVTKEEEPPDTSPRKKYMMIAAGLVLGVFFLIGMLRSPKEQRAYSASRRQPRPDLITAEEQRLKFAKAVAPVEGDVVEAALTRKKEDDSVFGALVPPNLRKNIGKTGKLSGHIVYQRHKSRSKGRRPESGGNTIIVWQRAGVSTGEAGGFGVVVGSLIDDVMLMNRIVSYNVESPVRAELRKPFEIGGREILPKGSIFLGTAQVIPSIDRVHVKFKKIITPDHKEIPFKGRALMEDGSQGIVGEVDLRKDVTMVADAGSAFANTARAAVRSTGSMGFGAQFGANFADESLRGTQRDLNRAGQVDRVITVSEYTPIQIYVDETF